ncbi:MAG: hypothetical protein GY719_30705 [bacterium]|nr:hypothetical protein [bacterium]
MLPEFELEDGENIEVRLVSSASYTSHANQVAAITNKRFLYIKRKEFSKHPYALECFPADAWSGLRYRASLALVAMFAGVIMVVFGFLVFYFRTTGELEGGVGIGLALLMIISGGALALGVRRHKLQFTVGDRTLRWRSRAMTFRGTLAAVRQTIDLAKELGIPVTGSA